MSILLEDFNAYIAGEPPSDPPWRNIGDYPWVVTNIISYSPLNALTEAQVGVNAIAYVAPGSESWTNYQVTVKILSQTGMVQKGIFAFGNLPSNAYMLRLVDRQRLFIYKNGYEIVSFILPKATVDNVWYWMKLYVAVAVGATLIGGKFWKDGDVEPDWQIEFKDISDFKTQGSFGFVSRERVGIFDDVQVDAIVEPPPIPAKTLIMDGIATTEVPLHGDNHLWGQLQGPPGIILPGMPIYLNMDGRTMPLDEVRTPMGYGGDPAAPFPYPFITKDDGTIDLAWKCDVEGTHVFRMEFQGTPEYEPTVGIEHTVEVIAPPTPPTAPIVQYPSEFDRRANPNPIGLADKRRSEAELDAMVEAGVAWIRFDFSWEENEAVKGVYDFSPYDAFVKACVERHISMLPTLGYGNTLHTGAWNNPPLTEEQLIAWENYVKASVAYLKPYVQCYEVWNEPNAPMFWGGAPNAAQFTEVLKRAYNAIKEIDPSAIVVGGGIWGAALEFLTTIYENGGKNYMDAVSMHPYCGEFLPNHEWPWYSLTDFPNIKDFRDVMRNYGDGNKPIWITEFGYNTSRPPHPESYYLGDSYDLQADGIEMAWNYSQWPEADFGLIAKYFIHLWRDPPTQEFYGLLFSDGTPKKAFDTYKNLALTYNTAPRVTEASLTVETTPISGVPITIDGNSYVTPITVLLLAGIHTVGFPSNVIVDADVYNFVQWNGNTPPTAEINLLADASIIGTYELYTPPPPAKGRLQVHAFYDGEEVAAEGTILETGQTFTTPDTLELDPGDYTVRVVYPGQTQEISTQVIEGQTVRIDVMFTPAPPVKCFIATAVYGSPLAGELNVLRAFRDKHLPDKLVKLYYKTSPPLARAITRRDTLRLIIRTALNPIIKALERRGYSELHNPKVRHRRRVAGRQDHTRQRR